MAVGASSHLERGSFLDDIRGGLSWRAWGFPGALAFLLSFCCIGFTYLWDDFYFLNNSLRLRLWDFVPDPGDVFYRPISRGVYFSILSAARDSGALLGHWINIVTLSLTACLVGAAGARMGGARVGICSGALFAGLACVPTLVAWTCCSQDLLAMLFVMLALHCRLSGRKGTALLCFAAAVLSKETALVTLPGLLLARGPNGGSITERWREAVPYVLFIGVWAAVHPAMRILLARGFRQGSTGYVGLAGVRDSLAQAGIYVLEFFNLRLGPLDVTWTKGEIAMLLAVGVAAIYGMWRLLAPDGGAPFDRGRSLHRDPSPDRRHLVRVGLLLAAGPWLLTSMLVIGWSQYYAAFPALGTCLVLGSWLADRPRQTIAGIFAVFLVLGLFSRASESEAQFLTEGDLRVSNAAHERFRESLFKLQPTPPSGAQLLMSVQASGRARVYHQVFVYQMPGVWYHDPTILVRKPEERARLEAPEFLFAVTQDLDVVKIDPATFRTISARGGAPAYLTIEQALRTYAMGLAGSGETDNAARLLVEMPEIDRGFESMHHRMAVMILLGEGREEDARKLATGIPPATREWALANLPAVLAQQPPSRNYDAVGMRAFGIDSTDADALRSLAGWYTRWRYPAQAGRFGDRLLAVSPGDPTGLAAIAVRDSVAQQHARLRPRQG